MLPLPWTFTWGGKNSNFDAGLYVESADNKAIKLHISNSLIGGTVRSGIEFWENVQLSADSTGNDLQAISVSTTGGSSADVTQTATLRKGRRP
jgi:hypothetical protein